MQTFKIVAFTRIKTSFALNLYSCLDRDVKKGHYAVRHANKIFSVYDSELNETSRKTTLGIIFNSIREATKTLYLCEKEAVIVKSEFDMKSAISPGQYAEFMRGEYVHN